MATQTRACNTGKTAYSERAYSKIDEPKRSGCKIGAHVTFYFFAQVWSLATTEIKSWVFKAFPRLRTTLQQKDKLTGLYHGPASFFLANVSEYKADLQGNKAVRNNKFPL